MLNPLFMQILFPSLFVVNQVFLAMITFHRKINKYSLGLPR